MGRIISKNWLRLLFIFLTAFSITLIGGVAAKTLLHSSNSEQNTLTDKDNIPASSDNISENNTPTTPTFINLQPTIDAWASTMPGNAGVMIYDLDNQKIAAEYNADEIFNMASVYKLFFVYDGYQQIDAGNDDSSAVVTYDRSKGGNLSLGTCLDLMVRESYNPCADPIRANEERYMRVENFINSTGLTQTSSAGLYSSARDITTFMQILWQHQGIDEENWNKLLDSMLNQPITTYDWRQGLPAGFNVAKVYDKVGWNYTGSYWSIYNDVAFVEFPEQNRHYIIVVLTEGIRSHTPTPMIELGQAIEQAVLTTDINTAQ